MFTKLNITQKFARQNKTIIGVTFASSLMGSLLNVFIPLSIGRFYELVLHSHSAKGKLFDALGIKIGDAAIFINFFIALIVVRAVLLFVQKYYTGIINETFTKHLREKLFARQLSQSLTDFQQKPAGNYLMRYSGDMSSITKYISAGVIGFTSDVFFMVVAFCVLAFMNVTLTIIIVIEIIIGALIYFGFGLLIKNISVQRQNQKSGLLNFVSIRLHSFFTIKALNRQTPEVNEFNKKSNALFETGKRYQATSALNQSLLPVLFFGIIASIMYAIYKDKSLMQNNTDVVSFILLVLYMQSPFKRMLKVNNVWQSASISFKKLIAILNTQTEEKPASEINIRPRPVITMRNVSFGYEMDKPIINNFSYSFEPGNIYVIKGDNSSGKSTLLKLILNLYEPTSGTIHLGDYLYKMLTPYEIRKSISLVSEDAPLIGDTIFKAISYSAREVQEEKTKNILSLLEFGLNDELKNPHFKLAMHAANISKGQRTILNIARALNTNKKIILLDEPFINLDEKSIQGVCQLLNNLKSKKTIIIAAHNYPVELSTNYTIDLTLNKKPAYANS